MAMHPAEGPRPGSSTHGRRAEDEVDSISVLGRVSTSQA